MQRFVSETAAVAIPTSVSIPMATMTNTPLPTEEASFFPTALPEVAALEQFLVSQDGVDVVQIVSVRGQDEMVFAAEVIVYPGYNTVEFAEAYRLATEQLAGTREITDVSIIISDGVQAIDYVFPYYANNPEWQITALTFTQPPTPRPRSDTGSATAIPSSSVSVEPISRQILYADGSVRIRQCPRTDCRVMDDLIDGEAVIVVGRTNGDAVQGTTTWYQLDNGWFVHSELLTSTAPASVPNVSTNTQSQSQASWNCSGNRYNCADFNNSCTQVMSYWNACPGDPSELDRDVDGRPCETICGG